MPKKKITPARKQFLDIKAEHPDKVVLFRMGDFYECFDDDAELVARELELTLTARSNTGKDEDRIPMAGVPHHSVDTYVQRLVEKGYHVVIVDQLEDASQAKGVVKRGVTQIVTPGTITETAQLPAQQHNYLLGVIFVESPDGNGYARAGLAYADITTGEFQATEINGGDAPVRVLEEITRLAPREVIMPAGWAERGVTLPPGIHLTPRPDYAFAERTAADTLQRHFRVNTLAGFGLGGAPLAVCAAGGVLDYLRETQRGIIDQVTGIRSYSTHDFMTLDTATRRNLELAQTLRGGGAKGSLLHVLDRTITPMGARLLRTWVGQPLLDLDRLEARLAAVDALFASGALRAELAEGLRGLADIERLTNRVLARRAGARDLLALADSLRRVPDLRAHLRGVPELSAIYERLHPCDDAVDLIIETIADDAPAVLNSPGTIRLGVSAELDGVYRASREARDYIATLEDKEKARTGIKTLKVGYNKVFGYYIEISRALSDNAPQEYIRKQTLVNAERFITPEMKDQENIIVNADERILDLERALYDDLITQMGAHCRPMLTTARALAHLDALLSLAEVAAREGYTRPTLTTDDLLHIHAGRHPVVEQTLPGGRFVPNDTFFDEQQRIHLVTGPNMAGKSTALRQVALITLMAQIGSFVPADEATIGLVDRIFTRVGAQDEIHAGQSTFMVEMVETANILTHATPRSLVILDEIGRGTSTYDGMAIARAVIEYIHNSPGLGCKTLFATHYHELTDLEGLLPRVVNYNVAVAEEGEQVVFLHRVVPGRADRSYGIHVAALAGVPGAVVKRANELLAELEAGGSDFAPRLPARPAHQISMFDDRRHPAIERLQGLNIDQMSPIDAMTTLYELQRLINQAD
ncbi:MAG: DNA mismatch repair protein MutS [Anaerolineales bacterium]